VNPQARGVRSVALTHLPTLSSAISNHSIQELVRSGGENSFEPEKLLAIRKRPPRSGAQRGGGGGGVIMFILFGSHVEQQLGKRFWKTR